MTPEAKDAISHRGRAFRALVPLIAELTRGEEDAVRGDDFPGPSRSR